MPIPTTRLAAAAQSLAKSSRTLSEARTLRLQTIFLCHSHHDSILAKGLVQLFAQHGWDVYVDWMDSEMPDHPNAETAARIKQRISQTNLFLFLATANAKASRWCPWEIGYADATKTNNSILVVPTQDEHGRTHGNEYLQLYRHIDLSQAGRLAYWEPGEPLGKVVQSL